MESEGGINQAWLTLEEVAWMLGPPADFEASCRILVTALLEGEIVAYWREGDDSLPIDQARWEGLFQEGYYIDWDSGDVVVPLALDREQILCRPKVRTEEVLRFLSSRGLTPPEPTPIFPEM